MANYDLTFTGEETALYLAKARDFSGEPLGDGLYSGTKTYISYQQYLNDNGALFKLNPTVALGYGINIVTYPTANLDPNLIPYTSFESASTEAIAEFNANGTAAIESFDDDATAKTAQIDADVATVEADKTQAVIDIAADVAEVEAGKAQAVIDIAADVAEVDVAASAALVQITSDLATVATEVNTINDSVAAAAASESAAAASESAAASSAFDANASALTAQSTSGFVGKWADQTGAANINYSAWHTGANWQLLNNLADVTLSEPSTANTDWSIMITSALSIPVVSLPFDNTIVEKLNGALSFTRASTTGNVNLSGVSETLATDEPAITGV